MKEADSPKEETWPKSGKKIECPSVTSDKL